MSASAKTLRALRPIERLSDETLFVQAALIEGQWRVSEETRPVVDPASEETIGFVPALGTGETREAIDAASSALVAWRAMLPQARTAILRRWHDLILAAREDLAVIMTSEQGKPIDDAQFQVRVLAPGPRQVDLKPRKDLDAFSSRFTETAEAGDYWVEVNASRDGQSVGLPARARFLIDARDLELDDPAADPGLLEQ